jgi:error-prone DNA polymerase
MLQRGLNREFAEQVFMQIRGFGEYGFPESHAASFALLVYVSAWLKYHHPAVFSVAVINSQPMGFYSVSDLITDVRRHSVTVLPVDVNHSDWDCTLEKEMSLPTGKNSPFALRLGLRVIHGIRQSDALRLVANRALVKYSSIEDLRRRGQVTRAMIIKLADADAFSSFERDRRTALWEALAQEHRAGPQPLFNLIDAHDDPMPELPPMRAAEQVEMDYRTAGFSLKGHPLMFWRTQLNEKSVVPARQLKALQNNRYVRVAGIVTLRQRPATAKGITFVTLEDETGTINIVLRQHIWERYYSVARRSNVWLVHGKLEKKNSVIHVVAHRLEDLSGTLSEYQPRSRDFK